MNKDSEVVKSLAELGFNVTPKQISPELQKVLDRINEYEKEMGAKLDPKKLSKYLG